MSTYSSTITDDDLFFYIGCTISSKKSGTILTPENIVEELKTSLNLTSISDSKLIRFVNDSISVFKDQGKLIESARYFTRVEPN